MVLLSATLCLLLNRQEGVETSLCVRFFSMSRDKFRNSHVFSLVQLQIATAMLMEESISDRSDTTSRHYLYAIWRKNSDVNRRQRLSRCEHRQRICSLRLKLVQPGVEQVEVNRSFCNWFDCKRDEHRHVMSKHKEITFIQEKDES